MEILNHFPIPLETPFLCSLLGGFFICLALASDFIYTRQAPSESKQLPTLMTLDSYSRWRLTSVAGYLFTSSLLWFLFQSREVDYLHIKFFEKSSRFFADLNVGSAIVSALLGGMGARLIGGGIDTYGFYGLPRRFHRAIVAMACMLVAGGLANWFRYTFPHFFERHNLYYDFSKNMDPILTLGIPFILLVLGMKMEKESFIHTCASFGIGCLLSLGVMVSGMANRLEVLHTLPLNKAWSPSLLYISLGAFLCSIFVFRFIVKDYVLHREKWFSKKIDKKLVIGSILYGLGIGISGLTPGTGLVVTPAYLSQIGLFFLPFAAIGDAIANPLVNYILPPINF